MNMITDTIKEIIEKNKKVNQMASVAGGASTLSWGRKRILYCDLTYLIIFIYWVQYRKN